MGLMLADWSIHVIKSKRQKAKQKKEKKEKKDGKDGKDVHDKSDEVCTACQCRHQNRDDQAQDFVALKSSKEAEIRELEAESARLRCILEEALTKTGDELQTEVNSSTDSEDSGLDQDKEKPAKLDIVGSVQNIIQENQAALQRVEEGRKEMTRLAEGVGRQLQERDNAHADRIKSLEILMNEKEKQLLQSSNLLRQQLAAAKRELDQLHQREEQLLNSNSSSFGDNSNLEQEVASLRLVLEMRRVEVDQLRAANNALLLDIERCRVQELQLQQHMQRVEEMEAVIRNKNHQIRKLCEDQEALNHQLEIEESAHLACQQELERSQWALENFMSNNREKVTKNLLNMKESGLILDIVNKDKSVAYSINC